MTATVEKARAERLQRLKLSVERCLEHPDAALEALMAELQLGELHGESWEGLHAAAARDGKESELARAYEKITVDRRLKQLNPEARITLLLHAADFSQGIVGDGAAAERFLWRVLEAAADHVEAFARLERRFGAAEDKVRLAELYALVAAKPSQPPGALAKSALEVVSRLPSRSPLSDEACQKLLVLLPESRALLGVLETHCRNTGRFGLACTLLEASLDSCPVSKAEVIERRRRLIDLYIGDAKAPEKAMAHIEDLLNLDPNDAQARGAAERLLRNQSVASRAAAALQAARQHARERTGKSQPPPD
jgi:hypothetical protein